MQFLRRKSQNTMSFSFRNIALHATLPIKASKIYWKIQGAEFGHSVYPTYHIQSQSSHQSITEVLTDIIALQHRKTNPFYGDIGD